MFTTAINAMTERFLVKQETDGELAMIGRWGQLPWGIGSNVWVAVWKMGRS